jgi:hypothetical protein
MALVTSSCVRQVSLAALGATMKTPLLTTYPLRRSPVTTKSVRRLPHCEHTSRACQSGTLISAP